jgi:hypothetical protein
MATQATAAYGIQQQIGTTTIPELVSISDLGGQFAVIDVSAHDGSGWTSRIPTLLDGGVIRLVFNFIPANAQHIALRTAMLARTSTAFRTVFPNAGPTWTYNAFVTSYRVPTAAVGGALQLNVDLQVDGAITMS